MIIDQLPLLAGDVQTTDEIPIERGTTTYKTTQAALVKSAADAAAAAQSTADSAASAASNAQSTADAAQTAAGNAQTTADTANAKGLPSGGTAGQVLSKTSATNYAAEWIDPPSGGAIHARLVTAAPPQTTIAAGSFADVTVDEDPPLTLIGLAYMYSSTPTCVIANAYLFDGTAGKDITEGVAAGDIVKVTVANYTSASQTIPAVSGEVIKVLEFYT